MENLSRARERGHVPTFSYLNFRHFGPKLSISFSFSTVYVTMAGLTSRGEERDLALRQGPKLREQIILPISSFLDFLQDVGSLSCFPQRKMPLETPRLQRQR